MRSSSRMRGRVLAAGDALHLEPEGDVVVDRHVREEGVLLEDHVDRPSVGRDRRDVVPLQDDTPHVGLLEAGDHAQRRRLAAAARAEQREELPLADLERHVVHGRDSTEALADAAECDRDASVLPHAASSVTRPSRSAGRGPGVIRPREHGSGSLGGDRRADARGAHGRGERADVVGAVVAAAVDEERRRAGDAAEVGAVDVLGDARGTQRACAGRRRTARRRARAARRSRARSLGRSASWWSKRRSCISQKAPCSAAASAASAASCARGWTSLSGRCRQT